MIQRFFEAAQHLALRIVKEGGSDPKARMVRGFRLCLARQPQPAELKQFLSYWTQQADRFKQGVNAKEALKLGGRPAMARRHPGLGRSSLDRGCECSVESG